MIYRIRIMRLENGVLVFDRYATDWDLNDLRVNANGIVEMLVFDRIDSHCEGWQDVSDTHFVEWEEYVDALRSRIEILTKAYESLPELIVSLDSGDLYDANNLSKVLDEHLKQMESK